MKDIENFTYLGVFIYPCLPPKPFQIYLQIPFQPPLKSLIDLNFAQHVAMICVMVVDYCNA